MASLAGKKNVKVQEALEKAAAARKDADKTSDAISHATRTPQQVIQDQAAQQIKDAANKTEINEAFNHGQKAHDDRLEQEEQEWKEIAAAGAALGEALVGNREFDKYAEHVIRIKSDEQMKPYDCMQFLLKTAPELRARMPWPKTEKKDMPAGSNQLWDKCKIYNEDGKQIASSFYREAAKATTIGQKHAADQTKLKKENKEENRTDLSIENSAVNALTRAMEAAGKLIIQIDRMKLIDNIEWAWEKDTKGEVKRTGLCIFVRQKDDITKRGTFSITQFCSWRITKAVIERGTIAALKKSVATRAKEEKPKEDRFTQKGVSEMVQAWNASLTWYRGTDPVQATARHKELMEYIGRADSVRWTAWKMYLMLKPIMEANDGAAMKLAKQYEDALSQTIQEKVG